MDGNEDEIGGMVEERRRTAKTPNRGVDAIRDFYSARVIISAYRG